MKEFLVKTDYGITYSWTREQVAEDYASTAIQWQHEDDIRTPRTKQQLYDEIYKDDDWLVQWFSDYIRDDIDYTVGSANVVSVDQETLDRFLDRCMRVYGNVIY